MKHQNEVSKATLRFALFKNMASNSTVYLTLLTENDIPGASLNGRNASELKNDELRFWLRCQGDSGKGLKTKAGLVKR